MRHLLRAILAGAAVAGALAAVNAAARLRAEARYRPRGRFLEVDGVRLHYIDEGEGEPIVLLHGNGSMHADFLGAGIVDALARRHRVIVFDRPGYGHSSRPRLGAWSPFGQADLFAAAFRKLGLDRPVVVGHSWGALLTMCLALEHPASVGSAVLLSGVYFPRPRLDAIAFSGPSMPVLGDAMLHTVTPLLARVLWRPMRAKVFAPQPVPDGFERCVPRELAVRPRSLRAASEEAATMIPSAAALEPRYAGLCVPVVLVAGREDAMVDTERQTVRLARSVPGAKLHLIPDAGHMVHHAAPEKVVDAVLEAVTMRAAVAAA